MTLAGAVRASIGEPTHGLRARWLDEQTVEIDVVPEFADVDAELRLLDAPADLLLRRVGVNRFQLTVPPAREGSSVRFAIEGAGSLVETTRRIERPRRRLEQTELVIREGEAGKRGTRSIRIHGFLAYFDLGGFIRYADAARIEVVDEDGVADAVLYNGITDVDGSFDFSFDWDDGDPFDSQPDLRLRFYAESTYAKILYNDTFNYVYSWEFNLGDDFTGTEISLSPRISTDAGALHANSTYVRAGRYFDSLGYSVANVDINWPTDAENSHYNRPPIAGIQITEDAIWNEATLLHEYGHHFNQLFSGFPSGGGYCNDVCDDDRCGHCAWCPENQSYAWTEGFASFIGYLGTQDLLDNYLPRPNRSQAAEWIYDCEDPDALGYGPVDMVEGFVTSLLVDCYDGHNENDPAMDATTSDESEMTIADMLEITTTYDPESPQELMDSIESFVRFSGSYPSDEIQRLWATARNNGFEIDDDLPTNPTSLVCTTHTVGVSSPINMVQFSWNGAADATSGVAGYAIEFSPTLAVPPSTSTPNEGATQVWTTAAPVAPGNYYFTLRTFDRSGKSAASYLTVGPIVVGTPVDANLTQYTPEFWTGPIVLTQTPGQVTPLTPDPLLPGVDAFLHYAFFNPTAGSVVLSEPFRVHIGRNGTGWAQQWDPGVISPGQQFTGIVPVGNLVAGRSSFRMRLDTDHRVPESNEGDNNFVRQYVIQPELFLPPDDFTLVNLPAVRGSSLESDTALGPYFTTVSGVRVRSDGWWNAFVAYTGDWWDLPNSSNSRMYLYDDLASGPESGFEIQLVSSAQPAGNLDAIFVNKNHVAQRDWDLGISHTALRSNPTNRLHHVRSVGIAFGATTSVVVEPFPRLELREFIVPGGEEGLFSATISVPPGSPELRVGLLDDDTTITSMDALTARAVTDSNGVAEFSANLVDSGAYCLVIWGTPDPDIPYKSAKGAGDITASVYVGPPLPDLEPDMVLQGWAKPLVPRRLADGTPASVPLPDYLVGDSAATYLNTAITNQGGGGAPFLSTQIRLDGGGLTSFGLGPINPYHQIRFNDPVVRTVAAGRHTLGVHTDWASNIQESNENNNRFAWQWAWRPPLMPAETPVVRTAPYRSDTGTEWIPRSFSLGPDVGDDGGPPLIADPVVWPNCDGLRPNHVDLGSDGGWWGTAILPSQGMTLSLNLHEATDDPLTGFAQPLVSSQSGGPNEIEFVLANHRATPHRAFDVGVVNEGDDRFPYKALSTASTFLDGNPSGSYGSFTLDEGVLMVLHEVTLDPGTWSLSLTGLDALADLGLSVHRPLAPDGEPYHARLDPESESLAAWLAGPGGTENIQFEVEYGEQGSHCIAVWRPRNGLTLPAEAYQLDFSFIPAAPPHVVVDGQVDAAYGVAVASQSMQTDFGDNQDTDVGNADGSELDAVFATVHDDVLYLVFAGNLQSNFNALEIFFDTTQGGQQRLRGDNPALIDDGLNRMGDAGNGDGLQFDPGFEADYYFTVRGGSDPYRCFLQSAELLGSGGGSGHYLGLTTPGPYGMLGGDGADNPFGVRMSIDNSNVGGVDAGTGSGDPSGVTTGIELAIPLAALGNPNGCIQVTAFVNGALHDYVSNQFLAALPIGTGNLGEPRNVDLGLYPGSQSFEICAGPVVGVEPPLLPRDAVQLHEAMPNPFNPRTTLSFTLATEAAVELAVYDLSGRLVRRLIAGTTHGAGFHAIEWDGSDQHGDPVASGAYFYRLRAAGQTFAGRMALLK